jgi:hypothetical protein
MRSLDEELSRQSHYKKTQFCRFPFDKDFENFNYV